MSFFSFKITNLAILIDLYHKCGTKMTILRDCVPYAYTLSLQYKKTIKI